MDGLFHGKPYEQMDDLGVQHGTIIFGNTHMFQSFPGLLSRKRSSTCKLLQTPWLP